jgi:hypothetical protein
MANFYKKPFIYIPKKKTIVQQGGSVEPKVGVPYEYSASAAVAIGQQAVTFWLTPFTKRTPNVPELTLQDKTIYYNAVYSTSATRISMFVFERRANVTISTLETNLGRVRFYDAGSGTDLTYSQFADVYFTFVSNNVRYLYKVNFTTSPHNIFRFTHNSLNVQTLDADVRSVPYFKLDSASPARFTTLYNSISNRVTLPTTPVKFICFPVGHNLTDDEVINICEVYWGYVIPGPVQTVTV